MKFQIIYLIFLFYVISISIGACSTVQTSPMSTPFIGTNTPIRTPSVPPISTSSSPTATYYDLLPPGQYVAYSQGENSLYVVSLDGKFRGRLSESIYGDSISPDGTRLVYVTGQDKSERRLWILDLKNNSTLQVQGGDGCLDASWSPDGTKLVCSDNDEIYIISLLDGSRIQLTVWSNQLQDNWASPIWSPDGKWIAFQKLRNPYSLTDVSGVGLYLTDTSCLIDETTCQAKTRGPFATFTSLAVGNVSISWSPDSRRLAFASMDGIYIYDINSEEVYTLLEEGSVDNVAWSRDGEWIAFTTGGELYLMQVTGGSPTLIANYGYVTFWLTILPDFQPGVFLSISPTGANLNLRSEPSLIGTILRTLQSGSVIEILDGPVMADSFKWWYVDADGSRGWVVEMPLWYLPHESTR